jgi:hypothetical protein
VKVLHASLWATHLSYSSTQTGKQEGDKSATAFEKFFDILHHHHHHWLDSPT